MDTLFNASVYLAPRGAEPDIFLPEASFFEVFVAPNILHYSNCGGKEWMNVEQMKKRGINRLMPLQPASASGLIYTTMITDLAGALLLPSIGLHSSWQQYSDDYLANIPLITIKCFHLCMFVMA